MMLSQGEPGSEAGGLRRDDKTRREDDKPSAK